ncbi:putative transmembrane protein, partial [Toxoplasma gondii MAS]
NPQSAGGQRGFSPPTLKTLLWTGGLLLLHAVLGVAGASALLTAIGRLPLGLRPESVVAAMVILQWWLSAVAYRTHEPVDGDNFDDAEDDFDADDSRPKVQDGSDDDDAGDDDLSGPLDD